MSQARFQKRQREKARQEKQALKRERRAARAEAPATEPGPVDAPPEPEVLAELAAIHQQFEDGKLDFEEFEDRKRELTEQLDV